MHEPTGWTSRPTSILPLGDLMSDEAIAPRLKQCEGGAGAVGSRFLHELRACCSRFKRGSLWLPVEDNSQRLLLLMDEHFVGVLDGRGGQHLS